MTTAATGLLCLLGDPVAHSLSPQLHTAALAACGIDAVYVACRVRDVPAAVDGLDAAKAAIELLKSDDGGRAALLVGSAPTSEKEERPALPEGARWAADLVHAPAELKPAVDTALRGVAFAPDLETARSIAAYAPTVRAVTREGDIIGAYAAAGAEIVAGPEAARGPAGPGGSPAPGGAPSIPPSSPPSSPPPPGTRAVGGLGEQPVRAAVERAASTAAPYDDLGGAPVSPTFEVIATIASASASFVAPIRMLTASLITRASSPSPTSKRRAQNAST